MVVVPLVAMPAYATVRASWLACKRPCFRRDLRSACAAAISGLSALEEQWIGMMSLTRLASQHGGGWWCFRHADCFGVAAGVTAARG